MHLTQSATFKASDHDREWVYEEQKTDGRGSFNEHCTEMLTNVRLPSWNLACGLVLSARIKTKYYTNPFIERRAEKATD